MKHQSVLRVVVKVFLPFIALFALYVQFHGDYGPGGGFQAGVIFAAMLILYTLLYGLRAAHDVMPGTSIRFLMGFGLLLYVGVGLAGIFTGGNFLDYSHLRHHAEHGQHLGILLVELGVGITVAAVMVAIFFTFADRKRR